MWLLLPVVVIVVLAVVGAIVVSGIYAAVLIPIAAVALLIGLIAIWRRAQDPEFRRHLDEKERRPLGGTGGVTDGGSAAPSTPDQLADARRSAQ
jgi:uncharacterized membrane protein YfcA